MNAARRKLIEVALPLEAINQASAREKSIRHGRFLLLTTPHGARPSASFGVRSSETDFADLILRTEVPR